jgi:hypothetical protein
LGIIFAKKLKKTLIFTAIEYYNVDGFILLDKIMENSMKLINFVLLKLDGRM